MAKRSHCDKATLHGWNCSRDGINLQICLNMAANL